ncbi:hypothetical protein IX46_02815 [Buchnera aphidicola (Aphis glycines)]|uniref:Pimeloyl-[acyl-carrier protein] methyl ester esterase n=1 Tax=Buchnera aphidicola (Aphis glycines) TaxID=1265350 RepID=A0A0M3RSG7_9GAMM|nr:pimeloyl-ACP methyl ester esterase BioH [Buchnera aphidicola]ALD15470.1 hypothetical protein IX46_02815 [Buchnera aphidicola (Aphis glycines)]
MKKFTWKVLGNGKNNLIILNGWGMNYKIWFFIIQELSSYFRLHLIDLPGIGINKNLNPTNMQKTIEILNFCMPKNSIYLGWSLGGLIATNFALLHPKKTLGLISVSSSPYFIKQKNWPGIEKRDLYHIYNNLLNQYQKTINNFLFFQTSQERKHLQDLKTLKTILSGENHIPNQTTLKKGLEILLSVDLRCTVSMIKVPFLRIYGTLDTLVPKKISSFMDLICPKSTSIIIEKAGHTPFISHKKEFCSILLEYFSKQI